MNEKIILYYHPEDDNGYLSNWYPSKFKYIRGEYSTSEQYMMQSKALLFGADALADKIQQEKDPAKIKKLGRSKIDGFNDALWQKTRMQIMRRGLREKFRQNPELMEKLLNTGNAILAEASSFDSIWAIGLNRTDRRALDVNEWGGKNLLGKTLMTVRRDLRIWRAMKPEDISKYNGLDETRIKDVLSSQIGRMTFGELHHLTGAAAVTDCYVDICVYLKGYKDREDFYRKNRNLTLHKLYDLMEKDNGTDFPSQGFLEMIQDLSDMLWFEAL